MAAISKCMISLYFIFFIGIYRCRRYLLKFLLLSLLTEFIKLSIIRSYQLLSSLYQSRTAIPDSGCFCFLLAHAFIFVFFVVVENLIVPPSE